MFGRATCLWILFLCTVYQPGRTFNLEPRVPVIKQGKRDSYFGYSVAEHQIVDEKTRKVTDHVILIGAPRAQTDQPGTNRSGAVYRCNLTNIRKDCEQLLIDQDTKPPPEEVLKDDQWLGVTLKSQGPGGPVMTCAHRYVTKGADYQWGQGICYSLTQYLDLHKPWEPCLNRPVTKAHEQFGYCQAGTSGDISEDNDIIIGSPGPYTWKGTLFTNSIHFRIRDDMAWYFGPLLDKTAPVEKYSYLGMSVTSGRFFGKEMIYVGGAPRSNGTGQVIFFQKDFGSSTLVLRHIINGEQFASSFGYTLTSLDLNGDGLKDLVVGAPFYYGKRTGGAVYIYMNTPQGLSDTPVKLNGTVESRFGFSMSPLGDINQDGYMDLAIGAPYEKAGTVYIYLGSENGLITEPSQVIRVDDLPKFSRGLVRTFGYSLSGGLDLDSNGYPDLLVGAYESDIAILIRSRPIINITTFVEGNLTNIDPSVLGCAEDPTSKLVCFSFEACFRISSSFLPLTTSIKLHYHIEGETFNSKKYYRIKFQSSLDSEAPNIVDKDITVEPRTIARPHCSKEVVYIKEKSDIQNPIQFKMTYTLIQKEPRLPLEHEPLIDINKYPILNQREASRSFEAKFLKDCGDDEICSSDLSMDAALSLPKDEDSLYLLFLGEKHLNITIRVVNKDEPAYDTSLFVYHSPNLNYIGRKTLLGEQAECIPYNSSILKCEIGNPFKKKEMELQLRFNPRGVSDDEKILNFRLKLNTTSNEDPPVKDIILLARIVRKAELELRGVSTPEQVIYTGEVVGESAMGYLEDVGPEVTHTYQIINHGPWKAKQVQLIIHWPYEIENTREHGKWLLYIIEPPIVSTNGYCKVDPSWINPLKLEKKPKETLTEIEEDMEYLDKEFFDKLRKKKREAPLEITGFGPEELRRAAPLRTESLDCETGTAKCFQIICTFRNLLPGEPVIAKVKSRLWNSTFVEDYPSVDLVRVVSRARIIPDPSLDIHQSKENDEASAETRAYPSVSLYQKPEEVPWWIIILSVVLGIFLLALLVFFLWKFGFFKRKKPTYIAGKTLTAKEREANNI